MDDFPLQPVIRQIARFTQIQGYQRAGVRRPAGRKGQRQAGKFDWAGRLNHDRSILSAAPEPPGKVKAPGGKGQDLGGVAHFLESPLEKFGSPQFLGGGGLPAAQLRYQFLHKVECTLGGGLQFVTGSRTVGKSIRRGSRGGNCRGCGRRGRRERAGSGRTDRGGGRRGGGRSGTRRRLWDGGTGRQKGRRFGHRCLPRHRWGRRTGNGRRDGGQRSAIGPLLARSRHRRGQERGHTGCRQANGCLHRLIGAVGAGGECGRKDHCHEDAKPYCRSMEHRRFAVHFGHPSSPERDGMLSRGVICEFGQWDIGYTSSRARDGFVPSCYRTNQPRRNSTLNRSFH